MRLGIIIQRSRAQPLTSPGRGQVNCFISCYSLSTYRFSSSHTERFSSKVPSKSTYLVSSTQSPQIKELEFGWDHPTYTQKQMREISIAHREPEDWTDRVALETVRMLRRGMDLVTGYKHPKDGNRALDDRYNMTGDKWMRRFIFLESVAGVPGMVGGMLRHLKSLRRMKGDNGWIETLLEEAFNERMHLLTFLGLSKPGLGMRLVVIVAQGVFFNTMFLSYLASPRICHRFVGYLEEEAVVTYTRALADIDAGRLPEWTELEAPELAVRYWDMPEGQRSMRDLLLYIRADEAKHREVNHTLSNLDQQADPNPFKTKWDHSLQARPTKGIQHLKPTGWEKHEVA